MGLAVVFNTVSIGVVMLPSLLSFGNLSFVPLTRPALIAVVHTIVRACMGSLVEILGIWLVGAWAFHHQEMKACATKRNIMRAAISLWLIALFLGTYV